MVDQNFQETVKKLFSEKKYDELIQKVEEYSSVENRHGGLSSVLGVCRMLKSNYTKDDVILALDNFEDAYFKLKDGLGGIEALGNYIAACIKNCNKF